MKSIASLLLFAAISASAQTRDYPKTPRDKPVHAEGAETTDVDRAIAPYVAQARKTYPAAKKRFSAGLPPKYLFSLTTKLWDRSHTKFEMVFVVADKVSEGKITGHMASHTKQPVGYDFGDQITFPESQVLDWTIVRPDGTEEGKCRREVPRHLSWTLTVTREAGTADLVRCYAAHYREASHPGRA